MLPVDVICLDPLQPNLFQICDLLPRRVFRVAVCRQLATIELEVIPTRETDEIDERDIGKFEIDIDGRQRFRQQVGMALRGDAAALRKTGLQFNS